LDRRKFLKYVGSTAAVVGASAVGWDYLQPRPFNPTPTQTSATTHTTARRQTTPAIKNLTWTPTKVVNGKVYEATVSFDANDPGSPIVSAELRLEPVYPSEIPIQAFTQEPSQSFAFTANSNTATFSQEISNLAGGKQYKASVNVRDQYGSESKASIDIPYVREFENITRTDNIVGATYHPWWGQAKWKELGADFSTGTTPLGTPLLGLYNSNDPFVISKHIDWATGHGINLLWCSYNGSDYADNYRMPALMTNDLVKDIKIAILYETSTALNPTSNDLSTVDLTSDSTYQTVESHFKKLVTRYFSHPSYLQIDGRPVVYVYYSYGTSSKARTDLSQILTRLRQRVEETAGFDLYLVGDELRFFETPSIARLKAFDAITSYGLPHAGTSYDKSPSTARLEYEQWQSVAHSVGVEIIPAPCPGYDSRNLCRLGVRPECAYLPKSAEFLASQLQVALDFVDKNRLMMIVSWDEWAENSFVEPTVEEGFRYLQTVRDILAGH
jgi:hypothetical protein